VRETSERTDASPAESRAAGAPRLGGRATGHAFRHSFAMHLLGDGSYIRTVQELLGDRDFATTMLYAHVLSRGQAWARSRPTGLLSTGGRGEDGFNQIAEGGDGDRIRQVCRIPSVSASDDEERSPMVGAMSCGGSGRMELCSRAGCVFGH
jgi:hypothetical protein